MAKKINDELLSDIINTLTDRKMTGYQVFGALKDTHPGISKRLIYHYLYLALKKGEISVDKVTEEGKFSWGKFTEKKYYTRMK